MNSLYIRLLALPFLLFVLAFGASAQKMSVASFEMDENDQTANLSTTMRMDENGEKCALIKIVNGNRNFSFDVGMLGVTDVEWQNEAHPGEIWLYVPAGVMKISIQHPQFGSIKDYDLGSRLKRARTYVLELTSDDVNTLVVDYGNQRNVDIEAFPANSDFYINGIRQSLDTEGKGSLSLPFGKHTYRVSAENYHPEEGPLIIDGQQENPNLKVRLKQAFGYLTIPDIAIYRGAEVTVDGKAVGSAPLSRVPVPSGQHRLGVVKKLYKPYYKDFTVNDSVTVVLTPSLASDYAEYELAVKNDPEAEIYDNAELLGRGRWKGKLQSGEHLIEVRKPSHRTSEVKFTVSNGVSDRKEIPAPVPIYGSLAVNTSPQGAEVYIDGNAKPAGKTPYLNTSVLVGPHSVKLMLKGHKTEERETNVREGEKSEINTKLTDYCYATLGSKPIAAVTIDGKSEGTTPLKLDREAGTYYIKLEAKGYCDWSKTMRLDGNTPDFSVKLKRNFVKKDEVYLQAGANFGNMLSLGFGLGLYVSNVNVEGSYILGLSKSDHVYWSDKSGDSLPFAATYTPSGGNFKLGYGISLGNRIRVTPQVGMQFLQLKEKTESISQSAGFEGDTKQNYEGAPKANTAAMTAGLRASVALAPSVGLSISPQYIVPVSKSAGYKALENVSRQIKGYANGFSCNASIYIFF